MLCNTSLHLNTSTSIYILKSILYPAKPKMKDHFLIISFFHPLKCQPLQRPVQVRVHLGEVRLGWVQISQVAPRKMFPIFWRSGGIVEKKTLKDLPLLVKPCAAHSISILQRKFLKIQRKILILAFLNLTFKSYV